MDTVELDDAAMQMYERTLVMQRHSAVPDLTFSPA